MKIKRKILLDILKSEWLYYLVSAIITIIGFLICSLLFFDIDRLEKVYQGTLYNMPAKDFAIMRNLGINGSTNPTYIFEFVFLLIFIVSYDFLWSYISYKKYRSDISILRIRGIGSCHSQYSFYFFRIGIFLFFNSLALLPYWLILYIIYLIQQTKFMLVSFNFSSLVFLIVLTCLFAVISWPFYSRPYRSDHLISFIRENY